MNNNFQNRYVKGFYSLVIGCKQPRIACLTLAKSGYPTAPRWNNDYDEEKHRLCFLGEWNKDVNFCTTSLINQNMQIPQPA